MNIRPACVASVMVVAVLLPGGLRAVYCEPAAEEQEAIAKAAKILGDAKIAQEERMRAAIDLLALSQELPDADRPAALKPLLDILQAGDGTLALAVLSALADAGTRVVIDGEARDDALAAALIAKLGSNSEPIRIAAEAAVSRQRSSGMEGRLARLAENEQAPAFARDGAARILGAWRAAELLQFRREHGDVLRDKGKPQRDRDIAAAALLAKAHGIKGDEKAAMLAPLAEVLRGPDDELALAVLLALGNTGLVTLNGDEHEKTLSAIVVSKMGAANELVRAAAVATTAKHRNKGMEGRLIEVVARPASGTAARISAAGILGGWGPEAAVGALIAACDEKEDAGVRIAASRALGEIGHLDAVDTLIRGLASGQPELMGVCREALRRITRNDTLADSPAAWGTWWEQHRQMTREQIRIEALAESLKRAEELVGLLSAYIADRLCTDLEREKDLQLVITIISNNHYRRYLGAENGRVILKALSVLAGLEAEALKGEKEGAMRAALNGLISFRPSPAVRLEAARMLGPQVDPKLLAKLGDESSVVPLIKQIEVETDRDVRVALVGALRNVVGPGTQPRDGICDLFLALLSKPDENEQIREFAADALGRLMTPRARDPLLRVIGVDEKSGKPVEPLVRVRYYALSSLVKLSVAGAVGKIVALLGAETDVGVRRHCIWALGELGGEAAKAAVLATMEKADEEYLVRAEAVAAAVKIGLPDVEPRLRALVIDPANSRADALVKAVITAIGQAGGLASCDGLAEQIKGADQKKKEELVKAGWSAIIAICERAAKESRYTETIAVIESLRAAFAERAWGPEAERFDGLLGDCRKRIDEIRKEIGSLAGDDPQAAAAAAQALGAKGPAAIEHLIEAIADPSEKATSASVELLKKITNKDFGTNQAAWRAWFNDQGR